VFLATILISAITTEVTAQGSGDRVQGASAPVRSSRRPRIERIFVPASRPELWPDGRWIPVETQRLLPLLTPLQIERTWLRSAEYSATFDPVSAVLSDGSAALTLDTTSRSGQSASVPEFLPLDPINISVQSATWSHGGEQAILGADPNGRQMLVTPGDSGTLDLKWSRSGRVTPFGLEFELALPRAIVTNLRLKIPAGWMATTAENQIPITAGDNSRPWIFPLGIRNRVRIRLSRVADHSPTPGPSTVAWQQNTRFAIHLDSVQASAQFTLSGPGRLKNGLPALLVPDEYRVDGIIDASNRPILWTSTDSTVAGFQQIAFVPGNSGIPMIDRFTLEFSPVNPAGWPQPVLTTPRLARGILLDGSRVSVLVAAPLVIESHSPRGLRIMEAAPPDDDAGGGEFRLTFQQFQPDSSLSLRLRHPGQDEASVEVRELALVQLDQTPPTLTADFQLTASTRDVFDFRTLLPAEWEINSVQLVTPGQTPRPALFADDRQITWQFQNTSDTHRQLTVNFADSLPLKRPVTLRIHAELPDSGNGLEVTPVSIPVGPQKIDLTVAVIEGSSARSILKSQLLLPLARELAPERVGWSRLLSATDEETRFWSTRLWNGPGKLLPTELLIPERPSEVTATDIQESSVATEIESTASQPGTPSDTDTDSSLRPVATALLESRISPGAGRDEHALTWQFLYPLTRSVFSLTLPESASLLSVEWNGERTPVSETDRKCSVPVPSGDSRQRLTVRYTLPSSEVFLRGTYRAAVPDADVAIAGFRWDATLPDDIAIVSFSDDFSVADGVGSEEFDDQHEPDLRNGMQTSRLVWFFGPLARSVDATAFNPFSADSWISWATEPASTRETADGWKTVSAESGSLPESFAVHICHTGRLRLLAWFLLLVSGLVGAVLRATKVAIRSRIGLFWMTGCVASATLIPETYAELVGAAVLGSFLSAMIPRSLIRPKPVEEPVTLTTPQKTMPSTVTMKRSPIALIFALTGLGFGLTACFGQEATTEPPSAIQVLIPYGKTSGSTIEDIQPKLVYVQESGLADLNPHVHEPLRRPDSLVTRAEYRATVDATGRIRLAADLLIAVRGQPEEIAPGIPSRFLTGRQECRLDGQPVRILPDVSGRRLIISLPGPAVPESSPSENPDSVTDSTAAASTPPASATRQNDWHMHTLSFDLLPDVTAHRDRINVVMPVPQVPDSRLLLEFAVVPQALRVNDSRLPPAALSRQPEHHLEPGDTLQIEWHLSQTEPTASQPTVECRSAALVYPAWTDRRLTARYPAGSDSRYLAWKLPPDSIVQEELVTASVPVEVQIQSTAEGHIVLLEVEPSPESFTVQIPWRQERLPDVTRGFDSEKPLDPFELKTELTPADYLAGFSPGLGFQFLPPDTENASGKDTDRDITVTAWQSFWPDETRSRPAERIATLESLNRLQLEVVPQIPVRTARPTQQLTMTRDQVQVRFSAEVGIQQAAAFVHELTVPERLTIDSVTVFEDDVDRLSHWSRNGRRVFLHLGSGTTGVQNVVLAGRLPVETDGRVTFGEIRVENADSDETTVRILHPHSLSITVVSGLEAVTTAREADGVANEPSTSSSTRYRFTLADTSSPRSGIVLLGKAATQDHIQCLTMLKTDRLHPDTIQADGCVLAHHLAKPRLTIQFPDWPLAPETRITATGETLVGQQFDFASGTLTLDFTEPVPDSLNIRFSATLDRTSSTDPSAADSDPMQLLPPVCDASRVDLFLVNDPTLTVEPSAEEQNLPADAELLEPLISEFGLSAEASTAASDGIPLISRTVNWQAAHSFSANVPALKPSQSSVLVMHALMPGRKSAALGLTRVLSYQNGNDSMDIDWPHDLRLIAVYINDQPQRAGLSTTGDLTIPLPDGPEAQLIEIVWQQQRQSSGLKIRRTESRMPVPRLTSAAPSPVLIIPAPGTSILPVEGNVSDKSLERLVQRLEEWNSQLRETTGREILTTRILEALAARNTGSFSDTVQQESSADDSPSPESRIQSLLVAHLQMQAENASEQDKTLQTGTTAGLKGVLQNRHRTATLVTVDRSNSVSLWVIDNGLDRMLTSLLVAVLAGPVFWILLSLQTGDRLASNPTASWLLLGVIWWLCLRASPAGLLLAAGSLVRLGVQRLQTLRRTTSNA